MRAGARAALAALAGLAALAAGAAGGALGGGAVTCAGCRALGSVLERELAGLEAAAAAEQPQRGRVMSVSALPHQEAAEYLQGACAGIEARAGAEGGGLGALCPGLVGSHAAPLADFVFAGGAEGLASHLCEHLSRSCDPDL